MSWDKTLKKRNPKFYQASNRLENLEDDLIHALERARRLAESGRFNHQSFREISKLFRRFRRQAKKVSKMSKERMS